MLIGLEFIVEIVETIIWTGALRDGIPLSCFLICHSGGGKSKLLVPFNGPSIHRSDDLTSSGLLEIMERDKENKVKHILISDLNAILSHKSSTTNLTIGNLLSLMSEGTVRIDDGRRNKEIPHNPIGLIVGITPEMFEKYFQAWDMTGFRRRFLPIFYDYKAITVQRIQRAIEDNKVRMTVGAKRTIKLPPIAGQPLWDYKQKSNLALLAYKFSENLSWRPSIRFGPDRKIIIVPEMGRVPFPFTPEQMLQELAEAHALRDKSAKVTEKDVNFAGAIVDYTRYGNPVQL
jgi:hypothetical protein